MTDWKTDGIRVVRANELDLNTPQTPGMTRAAAITHARAGASKLWAGTVVVAPDAKTGAHHHGQLETVLYIVRGRARFRWGEHLEFFAEADPGDCDGDQQHQHAQVPQRAETPLRACPLRAEAFEARLIMVGSRH